jgi:hypothetical protein
MLDCTISELLEIGFMSASMLNMSSPTIRSVLSFIATGLLGLREMKAEVWLEYVNLVFIEIRHKESR